MNASFAPAITDIIQKLESPGAPNWTLPQIEDELRSGFAQGLKKKDELAAFILFKQLEPEVFEISYLASAKNYQRTGLMTQLFNEFLIQISQLSTKKVELWLEVHEKNVPAITFYKNFGFSQVGRRENYYRDKGAAILYSRLIEK